MATVAIDTDPNAHCDYVLSVYELNKKFEEESFDSVLMFEVLEHLENPKMALREIHRVLKTGGNLVISIPNIMYFRGILRWICKGRISSSKEHISAWSLAEIEHLLESEHFRITDISFVDKPQHNLPSRFSWILPRITKHSLQIAATKMQVSSKGKAPIEGPSQLEVRGITICIAFKSVRCYLSAAV
jgi:SAM-dependent methyltransferase